MDALAALKLQIEWGADEALADSPNDRLSQSAPIHTAPPATRPVALRAEAASLEELRAALADLPIGPLRDTASHAVLPEGRVTAPLLLLGEAPSSDDDRVGRPFAGEEGAYLDKLLRSIGLSREDTLIARLLPWRPPGDRPPATSELAAALPLLHRLVALSQARAVVLAGPLVARALMTTSRRPKRGQWLELTVPGRSAAMPALVMDTPAAIRADPSLRRDAWASLRLIRRALDQDH